MGANSDEILRDRNETQQDPLERQDEIDQLIEQWGEKYALTPGSEEGEEKNRRRQEGNLKKKHETTRGAEDRNQQ